jgi:hypothetical protein
MPDHLILSDEEPSAERNSKAGNRPASDQEPPKRPKATRRPAPQMPDPAELVEQLRNVAGLVTIGILAPAKANVVVRCISKSSDIVMRSQTATPGGPNQPELVEACRENPNLISLLETLLTDEQLAELLRQVNDDDA